MKQDEKYTVDIQKFMAELRRYIPSCRECQVRRKKA